MAAMDSTRVKPHTCRTCGALFTPIKFRKAEGVFRAYTGRHNCSAECAFKAKGLVTKRRMRETRDQWVGPSNPMWKGACLRRNKSYRGPDWAATAEAMRKRDGYQCRHCGMTQADHEAKWHQVLEVHHIVPFTEFTDYLAANRPSNLVTLCKTCHMRADRAIRQRQLLMVFDDEPRKKSIEGVYRGANNARALLDDEKVVAIKIRLRRGDKHKAIAEDFGVKKHVIAAISRGQNWAHVPWPV